ncbi:MAG: hypothetical protein QOK44_5774 [Betaproteobacteria bacterium]|nr:hypothetical protein [Betaproteobacteria bacterium]
MAPLRGSRTERLNADRPEARSTLGRFYARRGLSVDAEAEYKAALRLSPQYVPAAINLADLYRQLGRDREGEGVLRAAVAGSPRDAGLHYSLGLVLTRLKRPADALAELARWPSSSLNGRDMPMSMPSGCIRPVGQARP